MGAETTKIHANPPNYVSRPLGCGSRPSFIETKTPYTNQREDCFLPIEETSIFVAVCMNSHIFNASHAGNVSTFDNFDVNSLVLGTFQVLMVKYL